MADDSLEAAIFEATTQTAIERPDHDPQLVARLQLKLAEYAGRSAPAHTGSAYKLYLLRQVLERGSMNGLESYQQLAEIDEADAITRRNAAGEVAGFDWDEFEKAFGVIWNYVNNQGAGNKNGQLPSLPTD